MTDVNAAPGVGKGEGEIVQAPRRIVHMTKRQLTLLRDACVEVAAYSDSDDVPEFEAMGKAFDTAIADDRTELQISYAPEVY